MSRNNRAVMERWIIEGTLELVTPTSLSNGDDDPLVDLPIVVDALEGVPLLTGASLAGALRAYVADYGDGYAEALFGGRKGNPNGAQSPLIVEDARGPVGKTPRIELRDGVSIDPATRTAKDEERYDRELLAAGTTFDLGFELVIAEGSDGPQLRAALAAALGGLQSGDIRLGGRKRRGYGQCRVMAWRAWRYELGKAEHVAAWLAHGRPALPGYQPAQWTWTATGGGAGIGEWPALAGAHVLARAPHFLALSATFDIDGAVLIRSGFETESGPDASHLRSHRNGQEMSVLSGTSLAGVIRAQARRIALTMAGKEGQAAAEALVNGMFGQMEQPKRDTTSADRRKLKKQASRVMIDESVIEVSKKTGSPRDIVQTRVKIDRFTGGAFESALFAEQPVFGGGFTLGLSLRQPEAAEVGLLLLVLKDLWTGFLPVGGSSSVGRGRLKGRAATVVYDGRTWTLAAAGQDGAGLAVSADDGTPATTLNTYVTAFKNRMEGRQDGGQ
jgi:CRISPR/Cas system CSM-associated protein Csm3 (group 7 of RAMP superfamily)